MKLYTLFSLFACCSIILPGQSLFRGSAAASCCTYYVDNSGSDSANGLTPATAWQTISKVNGTTLAAGQSVGFKRGGSWSEMLNTWQSGAAGRPITFTAYGSGAQPIIRGDTQLTSWTTESAIYYASAATQPSQVWLNGARLAIAASKAALASGTWWWDASNTRVYVFTNPASQTVNASLRDGVLLEMSYITISDLTLEYGNNGVSYDIGQLAGITVSRVTSQHNGKDGILLGNNMSEATIAATSLLVDSCTVQDNGNHGIQFLGLVSGSTISRNTVTGNGVLPDASYGWHGITLYGQTSGTAPNGVTVTKNTVTFQNGGPLATYFEGAGIQADDNTINTTISYNTAANNQGPGIVSNHNNSIVVAYNVAYGNGTGGSSGYVAGISITHSTNDSVYNNTVYNSSGIGIQVSDASSTGLSIKNNILMDNGVEELSRPDSATGFASDYNLVYHTSGGTSYMNWNGATSNFATWKTNSSQDANSLSSNPTFTNAGAGDFTLQAGSPAIAAGVYIAGVSTANPPNIGAK